MNFDIKKSIPAAYDFFRSFSTWHITSSIFRLNGTILIHHQKSRNSRYSHLLTQFLSIIPPLHRNPGHRSKIVVKWILILITGYKDDLQLLFIGRIFICNFIEFPEHWGKSSARRAPTGTKKQADNLGLLHGLLCNIAILSFVWVLIHFWSDFSLKFKI